MSTNNVHIMIKQENFRKISINISFLGLSKEFPRDSKAIVNEASVFESLRFTVLILG